MAAADIVKRLILDVPAAEEALKKAALEYAQAKEAKDGPKHKPLLRCSLK